MQISRSRTLHILLKICSSNRELYVVYKNSCAFFIKIIAMKVASQHCARFLSIYYNIVNERCQTYQKDIVTHQIHLIEIRSATEEIV